MIGVAAGAIAPATKQHAHYVGMSIPATMYAPSAGVVVTSRKTRHGIVPVGKLT